MVFQQVSLGDGLGSGFLCWDDFTSVVLLFFFFFTPDMVVSNLVTTPEKTGFGKLRLFFSSSAGVNCQVLFLEVKLI